MKKSEDEMIDIAEKVREARFRWCGVRSDEVEPVIRDIMKLELTKYNGLCKRGCHHDIFSRL
jgi:hypothetical protein